MTLRLVASLLGLLALGGCLAPTPPHRFEPAADDLVGWTAAAPDLLRTELAGVTVEADLSGRAAPVVIAVRNSSGRAVEVRMGVRATPARSSIGEVLLRPLSVRETARRAGSSDYRPYASGQTLAVGDDLGATFYLDRPLARSGTYGQYFVLELEVVASGELPARRALPLVVGYARGRSPGLR